MSIFDAAIGPDKGMLSRYYVPMVSALIALKSICTHIKHS